MNFEPIRQNQIADRYLDLLARHLCRFDGVDDLAPYPFGEQSTGLKKWLARRVSADLRAKGCEVVRRVKFDADARTNGRDHPLNAISMSGLKRLANCREAVRTVIAENIPGDIVETGVWRGGASIMMKATLEALGDLTRHVWCYDSFEGLPPPDMARFPQDEGMDWHTNPFLAVTKEAVQRNFESFDLLDDRVHFLKGWFKDTLPTAPIEQVAVLRLDGDLYASTMDALVPLYPKVSPGGFIIVDDYGLPQDVCRRAVEDFRTANGITDPIIDIDGWGKYWRKSA